MLFRCIKVIGASSKNANAFAKIRKTLYEKANICRVFEQNILLTGF